MRMLFPLLLLTFVNVMFAQMIDSNAEIVDVVIIGAGWAGLSAAKFLMEKNPTPSIAILEANDYIGGRSSSISVGDEDETASIDMGSEWIEFIEYKWYYGDVYDDYYYEDYYGDCAYEQVNEILYSLKDQCPLAEDLDFGEELRGDSAYAHWDQFVENKGLLTEDEKNYALDNFWNGEDGYIEFQGEKRDAAILSGEDESLKDILEDYEEDIQARPQLRNYLDMTTSTEITTRFGQDLEDISLVEGGAGQSYFLHQYTDDAYSETGSFYTYPRVTHGGGNMGNFANEFAKCEALSGNVAPYVRLNSKVKRVVYDKEYNGDKYAKMVYFEGSERKTIYSRAVISTVSLGVLKADAIKFDPPLPSNKQEVIDSMSFSVLDKWVGFWKNETQVPWDERINEQIFMSLINDGDAYNEFTFFFNSYRTNGHHKVLGGYIAGTGALLMENEDDVSIHARAMDSISKMFPSSVVPEPFEYKVTRWSQDPNFRGSYTGTSVGRKLDDDSEELAKPLSNLFFAGEATAIDWQGTVSGAYNSGEEVVSALWPTIESQIDQP